MKIKLYLLLLMFSPSQFALPFLIYYGNKIPEYQLYKYDHLVVDPDQYQNVWEFPNQTYAYLSMGEVENYRSYYQLLLKKGILNDINPVWPDARYVSLKDDTWKNFVLSVAIPNILEKGYKGIFLDTLDSLLESNQPRAASIDLINSIKKRFPKLKLMANRGFSLLKDLDVDSVLLESTISDYNFTTKTHSLAEPYKLEIPKNIVTFSLDYWPRSDTNGIRKIYQIAKSKNYIPLVSTVDLHKEPKLLFDPKSNLYFDSDDQQFLKTKFSRKVLEIYDFTEERAIGTHFNIETIFNYYGMHCLPRSVDNLPNDLTDLDGILVWITGTDLKDPLKFFQFLAKAKSLGIPILWMGGFPSIAANYTKQAQLDELIWKAFGIKAGSFHFTKNLSAKISFAHKDYHFEKRLTKIELDDIQEYHLDPKINMEPILTISIPKLFDTTPCFFSSWGAFLDFDKGLFVRTDHQANWYMNPYTLIERVFYKGGPIPDTTTIQGKRISYIHIDGDGVLSLSEIDTDKICGEVALEKIFKKYKLKTGVSYIANEIDKKYQGTNTSQKVAQDTFALDYIEAASHTYSHPFSWEKGIVAFSVNKDAIDVEWDEMKAKQEAGGILNLNFEIDQSMQYLSTFLPKDKKLEVIYYSGDCVPTKQQLIYLKQKNILAFNGGDSYYDNYFNSLTYVTALGRDVGGYKQIYSSNANENTYTDLWNDRFWGFARVKETWDHTGFPKRLKPINLYYHFYSLAKLGAYRALDFLYHYLDKSREDLEFIFPSQFIKIAHNFYSIEIEQLAPKHYKISNAHTLKEFRFNKKIKIKSSTNIKSINFNEKLGVTYLTLGDLPQAELFLE